MIFNPLCELMLGIYMVLCIGWCIVAFLMSIEVVNARSWADDEETRGCYIFITGKDYDA